MERNEKYNINLNVKYGYSTLINVNEIVENCKEKWFNQSLTIVNGCVVRLGIVQGKFHWHKHDKEDEFFFVLQGKLFLDLENETFELLPNHGYTVPKGVVHRTRSEEKTVMLMIEKSGVAPEGD